MLHEEGPFKEGFDTLEAFVEHARLHPLPSGPEWRLEKIKLDEGNAYLLSTRGLDDPGIRMADVELMHLKQTRDGWRLFDVTVQRQRKERGVSVFISFDNFGIPSADLAHHTQLSEGYERPDLADHPAEDNAEASSEPSHTEDAATDEALETDATPTTTVAEHATDQADASDPES